MKKPYLLYLLLLPTHIHADQPISVYLNCPYGTQTVVQELHTENGDCFFLGTDEYGYTYFLKHIIDCATGTAYRCTNTDEES